MPPHPTHPPLTEHVKVCAQADSKGSLARGGGRAHGGRAGEKESDRGARTDKRGAPPTSGIIIMAPHPQVNLLTKGRGPGKVSSY